MPSAPTPPGLTRSAPAQNGLPSERSTLARSSRVSSMSNSASASARIESTETWLLGGRLNVTTPTWPSALTLISPPPYSFFIGRSLSPRPQEVAGHHPLVDLGGAVVDAHGAQLLAHQVQRQLFGHAHGAEGLHRPVDHLVGHLGGEPFDHRDFEPDVAALVELPGAVVDHQAGRVDLGRGLGHPPLDRLALGERHAEG